MDTLLPKCVLCGYGMGDEEEREIARVASGQVEVGEKSKMLCFFLGDAPTIAHFHFDCLATRMDFSRTGTEMEYCGQCHTKLQHEPDAFKIELGLMDDDGNFYPYEDDDNASLLCLECMLDGMGEGNYEEGERILIEAENNPTVEVSLDDR